MSEDRPEFQALLEQLRDSSEEGARALLTVYGRVVLRIVRRRLHRRLRTQYDSQDVMQSIWAAFFDTPLEKRDFASPEDLINFLSRMATNKVVDLCRKRLLYQARNIGREQPLPSSVNAAPVLVDPGPTPSQQAVANETWEGLRQRARRPALQVLELLRQGMSYTEVAARLGVSERTIVRILRRLSPEFEP